MKQTVIEVLCDLCYDTGSTSDENDDATTTAPLLLGQAGYRTLDLCREHQTVLENLRLHLVLKGTPNGADTRRYANLRQPAVPAVSVKPVRVKAEPADGDCPECGKTMRLDSLPAHIYTVHGDGSRPDWLVCPDCQYGADSWAKLAIHRTQAAGHPPYDKVAEAMTWINRAAVKVGAS